MEKEAGHNHTFFLSSWVDDPKRDGRSHYREEVIHADGACGVVLPERLMTSFVEMRKTL